VKHRALFVLGAIAAFAAGRALADPAPTAIVEKLRTRQAKLMEDVDKIQRAAADWTEIQQMRATGEFVLNRWELKMEKEGRMDFHIFMERYRNDTLETLAVLDRLLGKEAYVDPLRHVFGDSLEERLDIAWNDVNLQDVVDWLGERFKAQVGIDGLPEEGLTITFRGNMTLLAAVLQIENLFGVRMRVEGKKLYYVVPDAK